MRLEHVRAKKIFFEERSMCNEPIKLRACQKIRLKGPAPESQKGPPVDRSFLARYGNQKWRFSLRKWASQNSSKMERFLYCTKMSTFFLLLTFGNNELNVHLFMQPFLNTFLDNEPIIGEHSR